MMKEVIELAQEIYKVSGLPLELCGAIAQDLVDRGYGKRDEWIPADDWPPESDGRYLMATDRGEILVAEWHDGILSCPCTLTTAVKWFMPAPELPEEL
jgi:hypothetical protein